MEIIPVACRKERFASIRVFRATNAHHLGTPRRALARPPCRASTCEGRASQAAGRDAQAVGEARGLRLRCCAVRSSEAQAVASREEKPELKNPPATFDRPSANDRVSHDATTLEE